MKRSHFNALFALLAATFVTVTFQNCGSPEMGYWLGGNGSPYDGRPDGLGMGDVHIDSEGRILENIVCIVPIVYGPPRRDSKFMMEIDLVQKEMFSFVFEDDVGNVLTLGPDHFTPSPYVLKNPVWSSANLMIERFQISVAHKAVEVDFIENGSRHSRNVYCNKQQ